MADLGVMELCSGFLGSSFSPLIERRIAFNEKSQISTPSSRRRAVAFARQGRAVSLHTFIAATQRLHTPVGNYSMQSQRLRRWIVTFRNVRHAPPSDKGGRVPVPAVGS